jgi:hypothetical protein
MKIYDCFTFYNEFELLELRLKELYDHVDRFVLVEANRTFQNAEKPFYFTEQMDDPRWKKYSDKITIVHVSNMPADTDAWGRERHQRDSIMHGCQHADPDDIIMIGDADEIPRIETIQHLRTSDRSIWGFRMPLFNFKYNYMLINQDCYSVWSGACRRRVLVSPEEFRRMRHVLGGLEFGYSDPTIEIVEHAGWHFTYLGNEEFARAKIQSFAHAETNKPEIINQLNIEASIAKGTGIIQTDVAYKFAPVAVDDYLPTYVQTSTNVIAGEYPSAKEFLPK